MMRAEAYAMNRATRAPARLSLLLTLTTLSAAALAPVPAAADTTVGLEGGWFDLTNSRRSAKAVFGSAAGGFTGGASLRLGLGRSFFVTGGARYFERTGERVFVVDATSPVFRLGHPLKFRQIPVYALLGYRVQGRRSPWMFYLGAGPGAVFMHEESEVGGLTEGVVDQTKASAHVAGGFEHGRGGLRWGLEIMYTLVPDSLGVGGVSQIYGEKDAGGFTAVARVGFGL
jgi:hypothetical protein